jgi:membrane associated rhomboid family serine protease
VIIPYRMETTFTRIPVANAILIAVTSLFFFFLAFGVIPEEIGESMVLRDWDLGQMVGNLFLHGGLFHLLGNMLFLWIFGNAVCALVGNVQYGLLYLFLGIVASATHLAFNGNPAIGASGAINGIVGMSLVLFPVNKLDCIYFFSLPFIGIFWKSGKFTAKAFWMILFWLVFDLMGVILGGGNVAYWAHVGGFGAGMLIGFGLIAFNMVETYDPTLMEVLTGKAVERESYDMEELAERIKTKKKREQELYLGHEVAAQTLESDIDLQPAELAKEPLPVLRVLKAIRREKDVYVYFINEGDTVNNVTAESREVRIGEISPRSLASKSTGWMKIVDAECSVLQNLSLSVVYDGRSGNKASKELKYVESAGRFVPVE